MRHPKQHVSEQSCSNIQLSTDGLRRIYVPIKRKNRLKAHRDNCMVEIRKRWLQDWNATKIIVGLECNILLIFDFNEDHGNIETPVVLYTGNCMEYDEITAKVESNK